MIIDENSYPNSAFYDSAYREYERINIEYNNLYNRVCGVLAFCGILIVALINIVVGNQVSFFKLSCVCQVAIFGALVFIGSAMCSLLGCLRGKQLEVLKVDEFRNAIFLNKSDVNIKEWIVDGLVKCVVENKKVREYKQDKFEFAVLFLGIGFILLWAGFVWEVLNRYVK